MLDMSCGADAAGGAEDALGAAIVGVSGALGFAGSVAARAGNVPSAQAENIKSAARADVSEPLRIVIETSTTSERTGSVLRYSTTARAESATHQAAHVNVAPVDATRRDRALSTGTLSSGRP